MSKQYEIRHLSQDFYSYYNAKQFPEILQKTERPYMVLLVQIDGNTFAIPFRTNINHSSCYKFSATSRNTTSTTGLDYSKAVIVNDSKYIGNTTFIDNSEYLQLNRRFYFIIKEFTTYVNGYKKFVSGKLNDFEAQKYQFTSLQYYHQELGIGTNSTTR